MGVLCGITLAMPLVLKWFVDYSWLCHWHRSILWINIDYAIGIEMICGLKLAMPLAWEYFVD